MAYQFQNELNEFRDLQHVTWVAEHIDEYEFHGNTIQIKEQLLEYVKKKNVYYSTCNSVYHQFVDAFDNNPYNYRTEVLDEEEDYISSNFLNNYFIEWETEDEYYHIPIGYILHTNRKLAPEVVRELCTKGKEKCWKVFDSIRSHVGETQNSMNGYINRIYGCDAAYGRTIRKDTIHLFIAVILFIVSIHNNYWFNGIKNMILSKMPLKEIFQVGILGAPKIPMILGIILCVLGVFLIKYIYILFQKEYILRRIKQLNRYSDQLKEKWAFFQKGVAALNKPIEKKIGKESYREELLDLIEISKKRFEFNFPKNLTPAQYPGFGLDLTVKIRKIIIFNVIILIILNVFF